MLPAEEQIASAERFRARAPNCDGGADVYIEADSFTLFIPLDYRDSLARLSLSTAKRGIFPSA
jgi:hypothetical protein